MTRGGDPERRVQRAASMLASSLTFLVTVADDEGIEVPRDVFLKVVAARRWARGLTDPPSPVNPPK